MIEPKLRPYFMPIEDRLVAFYRHEGFALSDNALFEKVCDLFGDDLLKHVCPHINPDNVGECATLAIKLMRELTDVPPPANSDNDHDFSATIIDAATALDKSSDPDCVDEQHVRNMLLDAGFNVPLDKVRLLMRERQRRKEKKS
jgi:hypothetical protein